MNRDIRAILMYEVLGKPPEHIKSALSDFIEKLGQNKGVSVKSKVIHDPKPIEQKETGLFTTFAEVEVMVENLGLMFDVILNTLPSHIEIIAPEELTLKNFDLGSVLSDLTIKMHRYDEIAKALSIERNNQNNKIIVLENKISELLKKDKKSISKEK